MNGVRQVLGRLKVEGGAFQHQFGACEGKILVVLLRKLKDVNEFP